MTNQYSDPIRIIELKESVLADNDRDAQDLRRQLREQKTCLLNLMSGPGSGKTATLLALSQYLKDRIQWGVMEAHRRASGSCRSGKHRQPGLPRRI